MKIKITFLLAAAAAFFLTSTAVSAGSNDYILLIHGRHGVDHCNPTSQMHIEKGGYWLESGAAPISTLKAYGNVRYVGYKGNTSGGYTSWGHCGAQRQIYYALNAFCKGSKRCTIIAHSMGTNAVSYFLSRYNPSTYGWNIRKVQLLGSSQGGSHLAELSMAATYATAWILSVLEATYPNMDYYLQPNVARSIWNHNQAFGMTYFMKSGDGKVGGYGWLTKTFLAGVDDSVVNNHSLCGLNNDEKVEYKCSYGGGRMLVRRNFWGKKFYLYRYTPMYTIHAGGEDHFSIKQRASYY